MCTDVELEDHLVGMSVNGKDFQDYIIDTKDESASFIVKSIVTNLFDCKLTKGQRAKLKSRKVIRSPSIINIMSRYKLNQLLFSAKRASAKSTGPTAPPPPHVS